MSTDLAVAPQQSSLSVFDRIADPMEACKQMGSFIAKSGMFNCTKEETGMVIAMTCLCERITPIEFSRTYHVITTSSGTQLAMRADSMLAKFIKRGGTCRWEQHDEKGAVAVFNCANNKDVRLSFTIEDAKTAGYVPAKPGSAWQKTPGAMMRARLISLAIRMLDPEVVAGTYTPEEVNDFDPMPLQAKAAPAAAAPVAEATVEPKKTKAAGFVKNSNDTEFKRVEAKEVEAPKAAEPVKEEPKPAPASEPSKIDQLIAVLNEGFKGDAFKHLNLASVESYLVNTQKLLKPEQHLQDLDLKTIEKIMIKPDAFLRAVQQNLPPKK